MLNYIKIKTLKNNKKELNKGIFELSKGKQINRKEIIKLKYKNEDEEITIFENEFI